MTNERYARPLMHRIVITYRAAAPFVRRHPRLRFTVSRRSAEIGGGTGGARRTRERQL